jgi:hypothetical protein
VGYLLENSANLNACDGVSFISTLSPLSYCKRIKCDYVCVQVSGEGRAASFFGIYRLLVVFYLLGTLIVTIISTSNPWYYYHILIVIFKTNVMMIAVSWTRVPRISKCTFNLQSDSHTLLGGTLGLLGLELDPSSHRSP